MIETCGSLSCSICRNVAGTSPQHYRPHTLTPDCWCQSYKDDYSPEGLRNNPKRCRVEKDYADLLELTT